MVDAITGEDVVQHCGFAALGSGSPARWACRIESNPLSGSGPVRAQGYLIEPDIRNLKQTFEKSFKPTCVNVALGSRVPDIDFQTTDPNSCKMSSK